MERVGYARVSTREKRQVFDRQINALRAAGCHRIFDDRGSRSDPLRPYRKFPHGCYQRAIVISPAISPTMATTSFSAVSIGSHRFHFGSLNEYEVDRLAKDID